MRSSGLSPLLAHEWSCIALMTEKLMLFHWCISSIPDSLAALFHEPYLVSPVGNKELLWGDFW